jgi:hypothetical protein
VADAAAVLAVCEVINAIRAIPQITRSQRVNLGIEWRNTVAKRRKREQARVRRILQG